MKNHRGKLLFFVALGTALFVGQMVYAAIEPGTAEDPLVTLSLVDKKIEQLKYYIDESLAALPQSGGSTGDSDTLEVVELKAGETLIGTQGTEMILRSGQATAVSSDLGGLADVTGAKDLVNGDAITANHLLLVPRDDGRGAHAITASYFMVRGAYTIAR